MPFCGVICPIPTVTKQRFRFRDIRSEDESQETTAFASPPPPSAQLRKPGGAELNANDTRNTRTLTCLTSQSSTVSYE